MKKACPGPPRRRATFCVAVRATYAVRNSACSPPGGKPSPEGVIRAGKPEPGNLEARRNTVRPARESIQSLAFLFMAATDSHDALLPCSAHPNTFAGIDRDECSGFDEWGSFLRPDLNPDSSSRHLGQRLGICSWAFTGTFSEFQFPTLPP